MYACKGVCYRIGFKLSGHRNYSKYVACRECERVYPKGDYNRCPCCSSVLSTKPRVTELKQKYIQVRS